MADAEMSIVIDLTNDSYTLVDHYTLANVVIELDDSTSDSPLRNRRNEVQKKQSKKLMKVAREEVNILSIFFCNCRVIQHNLCLR